MSDPQFHNTLAHPLLRRFAHLPNNEYAAMSPEVATMAMGELHDSVFFSLPNSFWPGADHPLSVLQSAADVLMDPPEGVPSLATLADRADPRNALTCALIAFCKLDSGLSGHRLLELDKETGELTGTSYVHSVDLGAVRNATSLLLDLDETIADDDPRKCFTFMCAELVRSCKLPNWNQIRPDELYKKTIVRYNYPEWVPSHTIEYA